MQEVQDDQRHDRGLHQRQNHADKGFGDRGAIDFRRVQDLVGDILALGGEHVGAKGNGHGHIKQDGRRKVIDQAKVGHDHINRDHEDLPGDHHTGNDSPQHLIVKTVFQLGKGVGRHGADGHIDQQRAHGDNERVEAQPEHVEPLQGNFIILDIERPGQPENIAVVLAFCLKGVQYHKYKWVGDGNDHRNEYGVDDDPRNDVLCTFTSCIHYIPPFSRAFDRSSG